MKEYLIGQSGYPDFKSALDAAEKATPAGEDVLFRISGKIVLRSPLTLENRPLFKGRRVVFRGENDAALSGGVTITGFTRWKDNIFRAPVPQGFAPRTLWVDGGFAPRPATEPILAAAWDKAVGDCDFYRENGEIVGLVTTRREILSWRNIRDVDMIFNVGWTHHIIPIESVEELPDGRVLIHPLPVPFRTSVQNMGVAIGGCPTCFENVFSCLSRPGEWYCDRSEGMLYLALADGDTPENHTVEYPLAESLLMIRGDIGDKIGNIAFENLTFRNTTFLRPAKYGYSDLQAGFARAGSEEGMPKYEKPFELDPFLLPGTVRVMAASNIAFRHCTFTALDSTALSFSFGAEDCRVENCVFRELGAGAVMIGDVLSDRSHHPDDLRETVRRITVSDCAVSKTGRDFFSTVALLLGYVDGCEILHNEITEVPYSAVSVGWGWGWSDVSVGPYRATPWKVPSVSRANKIAYNRIDHCLMTLYDGGAIYTLGAMEGTVITGNMITRSGGYDGDGYNGLSISGYNVEHLKKPEMQEYQKRGFFPGGIYLDEGSRGIEVFGNILYGVTVPLFYHNQIDEGYKRVSFHDNYLNLRPGDPGFPEDVAINAGRQMK